MKKLSKVTLKNFQNHKYTSIDLHPGVNLITGSSDTGKSAVLRAINWVLHNKPTRSNFVTNGEKETSVCIEFTDGNKITRIRSSDRNSVVWEDENGDVHEFDKIGVTLPVEVEKAMGFPPIDERHGPISYSDQLVNLYLVSLSSTDLPRALSELTGINDFEEAIQELSRQKRESDKDITSTQKHMDSLNIQLKDYDDLDKQVEFVEENSRLLSQIEGLQASIANLQKYSDQRMFIKNTAEALLKKNAIAKQKIQYEDATKEARLVCDTIFKAKQTRGAVAAIDTSIESKQRIIARQKMQLTLATTEDIENMQGIISSIQSARNMKDQYEKLDQQGKDVSAQIKTQTNEIEVLQQEKQTIIEVLKKSGEWCDRCKRPVPLGVTHND